MHFGKKNQHYKYKMNHLGVIVEKDLKFHKIR